MQIYTKNIKWTDPHGSRCTVSRKRATFVAEAVRSARQTATIVPEYPITNVADREPDGDCFDTVI